MANNNFDFINVYKDFKYNGVKGHKNIVIFRKGGVRLSVFNIGEGNISIKYNGQNYN